MAPEYIEPGVYVEETSFRSKSIEGVSTSTAAFVGPTRIGPADRPVRISSFREFERVYGDGAQLSFAGADAPLHNYMWHAARAFFAQGGKALFVQRVEGRGGRRPRPPDYRAALRKLEQATEVALVAAPGAPVQHALVEHAERARYRFALVDPGRADPIEAVTELRASVDSPYAALYHPWIRVHDPVTGREIALPPSGFVGGAYARGDLAHGVHVAPAGEPLVGVVGLAVKLSDRERQALASRAVNTFRAEPDGGLRLWGARTTSADREWKYVNVRRYVNYLEHSIDEGTKWTVFEPNREALWARVRSTIADFLLAEFRRGALVGTKPEDAFFVKCDRTTMTQDDIDDGRLVCLIGVAPVRPAEFVEFAIGRWTKDHRSHCSARIHLTR